MKKLVVLVILSLFSINSFSQEGRKEQKPRSIEELLSQMDTNKDSKISKKEVRGPLKDDFAKIDINKDGFLTKVELEKAPKPERRESDGGLKR